MRRRQPISQTATLFEPLEPRLLLDGDMLISELMADNSGVLLDGDG